MGLGKLKQAAGGCNQGISRRESQPEARKVIQAPTRYQLRREADSRGWDIEGCAVKSARTKGERERQNEDLTHMYRTNEGDGQVGTKSRRGGTWVCHGGVALGQGRLSMKLRKRPGTRAGA